MKKLIDVIQLVAEKYIDRINLLLGKDNLTLEYIIHKNGEQDLYKTIQIKEIENKFELTIFPEKIIKTIEINELEDIILILEKQCSCKEHSKEEIQEIKQKYREGTKIELVKMYDLQAPPVGTKGIILSVDDIGTINVQWENGSCLGLVVGIDEFKIICPLCNQEWKCQNE